MIDCPTCKGGGEVCEIPWTSWKGRPEQNPENAVCGTCPRCHGEGTIHLILIDFFCGAGGATKGYQRAGFYVIGVDINPQPRYCGDEFVQGDAVEVLDSLLAGGTICGYTLDDITCFHASPPCQAFSDLQKQSKRSYPKLIEPMRALLQQTVKPYVIENVEGAPLLDPITLCGTMFTGLRVLRHRLFESNVYLRAPQHPKHPLVFTHDKRKAHFGKLDQDTSFVQVTGGGNCTVKNKADAMGISWMTGRELNEAIPPAYCHLIGSQLRAHLEQFGELTLAA